MSDENVVEWVKQNVPQNVEEAVDFLDELIEKGKIDDYDIDADGRLKLKVNGVWTATDKYLDFGIKIKRR
ncbi:hypothetical protein ADU37_CDS18150 [Thermococcus sp. 2319x1]|uniref:hypothetical protein n=1 Tax=Thermococcus sp. 2319x1 TaxID=1674923 RepID=UPI00073A5F35|nr:hypothetical protein [Thermococcus sp. 2319x1]ALV63514.1 hypothetical protein ADU37_CDS18150 [Thermococcus sp. 2319x1]